MSQRTEKTILDSINTLIHERNLFVITAHTNPDGDALGSCYGLALALEKLGKRVWVVLEPYTSKYGIIPGSHLRYNGKPDALSGFTLFCLDCADLYRMGIARPLFDKADATICIDHHMTNTGFADINYLDGEASSTSELIYRLLNTRLDKDIAAALYAGIISDTDGFRFAATTRETLAAAGHLMSFGIPFTEIYTELKHRHSYEESKIWGRALDACQRCCEGRVIYTCITHGMMKACGVSGKDLDGIVEYLLNTVGAEAAVLFYEKKEPEVKISLRSNRLNVGLIAQTLGGGGHRQAAGCNINGDINEIRDRTLALIEQELNHD